MNQTGGIRCLTPAVRVFLVPVHPALTDWLEALGCELRFTPDLLRELDERLHRHLPGWEVAEDLVEASHEAWIWLRQHGVDR